MKLSVQIEFDKTLDLVSPKLSVSVGRSPENDLVIPHSSISRDHCIIDQVNNSFYITDLDSSNGTFINDEKLRPNHKTLIHPTSDLKLGKVNCDLSISSIEEFKNPNLKDKNATSTTLKVGRIDLNRPSLTLELEKAPKIAGPRNPVAAYSHVPKEREEKKSGIVWVLVFLGLALVAGYLLFVRS